MSRKVRLLVAVLVLMAATVQAFPLTARPAVVQRGDRIESILSWFTTALTSIWEREGSSMDPNGEPDSGEPQPAPTSDEGSQMDPNG
jgi:hypothetical protein